MTRRRVTRLEIPNADGGARRFFAARRGHDRARRPRGKPPVAEVTEPIVTLCFAVSEPVSINRTYGNRKAIVDPSDPNAPKFGGGRGQFKTRVGKAFALRLRSAAIAARGVSTWPANPWRARRVEIGYQLFDVQLDADAPRKAIRDAFERILYINDRIVDDGPSKIPIKDGKGRRVEICVKLLEIISDVDARKLQRETEAAALKRRQARARKKLLDLKKEQAGRQPGVGAATRRRVPTDLLNDAVPKVRRGIPR